MLKLIAIKQKADYRQRERKKESQNKTKIHIKYLLFSQYSIDNY